MVTQIVRNPNNIVQNIFASDLPRASPLANIPTELHDRQQWVCWNYEVRDDKRTKVLKTPNGGNAAVDRPKSWRSLAVSAIHFLAGQNHDGIGYVFTEDDPFFMIDLDKCRDRESGVVEPWAQQILSRFNTYTELSPSGRGFRIIGRGKKPGNRCRSDKKCPGVEIYDKKRFSTITGNRLHASPTDIRDCQQELNIFYGELFDEEKNISRRRHGCGDRPQCCGAARHERPALDITDEKIIAKIHQSKQGTKFRRLMAGDTSLNGSDHSASDEALCCVLAYWCGDDADRIERIWGRSALASRSKWSRDDYRDVTIRRAIELTGVFYDWGRETAQTIAREDVTRPFDPANQVERKSSGIESLELYPPTLTQRFSNCRKIKVRMTKNDNQHHKRIACFACGKRDCPECREKWYGDRVDWFTGIVGQWEAVHTVVVGSEREKLAIYQHLHRHKQRHPDSPTPLYIAVPYIDSNAPEGTPTSGILLLTNVATPKSTETPVSDAMRSLEHAVHHICASGYVNKKGKEVSSKISCTRGLAFKQAREISSFDWTVDEKQPPLHRASLARIVKACEHENIDHIVVERRTFNRTNVDYFEPDDWGEADRHAFDSLIVDMEVSGGWTGRGCSFGPCATGECPIVGSG